MAVLLWPNTGILLNCCFWKDMYVFFIQGGGDFQLLYFAEFFVHFILKNVRHKNAIYYESGQLQLLNSYTFAAINLPLLLLLPYKIHIYVAKCVCCAINSFGQFPPLSLLPFLSLDAFVYFPPTTQKMQKHWRISVFFCLCHYVSIKISCFRISFRFYTSNWEAFLRSHIVAISRKIK